MPIRKAALSKERLMALTLFMVETIKDTIK